MTRAAQRAPRRASGVVPNAVSPLGCNGDSAGASRTQMAVPSGSAANATQRNHNSRSVMGCNMARAAGDGERNGIVGFRAGQA